MCGGHKGIRCGDDLTGDTQRLQRRDQRDRAIGEQCNVLDTEVVTELLFQLLVKGAAVGQAFTVPDLFQVGKKLFQWR